MQQISKLELAFVYNICKIEVKAGHHHDNANIEQGYKFDDVNSWVGLRNTMKQKTNSIKCGNNNQVFIDKRMLLIFIFSKD